MAPVLSPDEVGKRPGWNEHVGRVVALLLDVPEGFESRIVGVVTRRTVTEAGFVIGVMPGNVAPGRGRNRDGPSWSAIIEHRGRAVSWGQ